MTEESLVFEPAVERWADRSNIVDRRPKEKAPEPDIMSLSAGIMASSQKATSNRIDGLLSKMVESHQVVKYSEDIDKNLDYLFTYLQLDMINILAENYTEEAEEPEDLISF